MRDKTKKITNRTKEDYAIPDFITYNVNLFKNNGRGIAIYIHQSISHRVTEIDHTPQFEEACVVEIQLEKRNKLVFGCFYRSPTEPFNGKLSIFNVTFKDLIEEQKIHLQVFRWRI